MNLCVCARARVYAYHSLRLSAAATHAASVVSLSHPGLSFRRECESVVGVRVAVVVVVAAAVVVVVVAVVVVVVGMVVAVIILNCKLSPEQPE